MNKVGQIVSVDETMDGLYRKGDQFRILEITDNQDLVPVKALHLRSNQVYYFEEGELI